MYQHQLCEQHQCVDSRPAQRGEGGCGGLRCHPVAAPGRRLRHAQLLRRRHPPVGLVTSEKYDSLGRLTAVWKPGHPRGSAQADVTFGYTVIPNKPAVTTTNTITVSGGYLVSESLYDSMGRAVETQTATADGNR